MGQNIVRIMNLGNSIERNPQCFPHGCRNEDKFAVASAMLKALLMSLDFYNILNMKEEKIVDHSAATALHAAMYIEEASSHFLEVGKLAKKFGLSRNRFTKVFTDYWQISPQEYLINYRISHAKNLLVNTAQTIGEIAARLGYSDPLFFRTAFKAKTGFSPGVFRKERSKEINSD